MVLDETSSQCPVNARLPRGSIFGPTPFLLHTDDLLDVFCNIAIYADDTTLYSKSDQVSALQQRLEWAAEIESDLQDTMDWERK